MTSGNRVKKVSRFRQTLDEVLASRNLSFRTLAEELDFTRQYISQLSTGNRRPSIAVQLKVLKFLEKAKVEPIKLLELLCAGMEIDPESQLFHGLFESNPRSRSEELEKKGLQTRCVISDVLGENTYDEFLKDTIDHVRDQKTRYFYFLPETKTPKRVLLSKIRERGEQPKKFQGYLYFLRAPEDLFVARLRIDNIGLPSQDARYSIGPPSGPSFVPMQAESIRRIVQIIHPIVLEVPYARPGRALASSPSGVEWRFELDG